MKIIVSSRGTSLDSAVDPQFGRAKFLLLVDTQTGECSGHDTAQKWDAPQGAGIQAAQAAARLGAEVVMTGHIGPNAFATLRAAGITVYTDASGTVRQAIDRLSAGQLQPADKNDVQGHWI